MRSTILVALALSAVAGACARATLESPVTRPVPARSAYQPGAAALAGKRPLTRAERTGFLETSRYADVVQFIDSLRALGAQIETGSIGKTTEGRDIPYVVAARPLVRTPAEARASGKPIVYVQANIHAGEVEGKEALQAVLRDLLLARGANVLDSIVLVAVPIYNADGNERFAPQARNRYEQNGPELVGQRPNAQGLDLNRDYVKAEAPETRASLAMFAAWHPDVFVDLHTTDGSYHGYALTYSPSLSPAALASGAYARDTILPELRRRVRDRHDFAIFDYGNFVAQDSAAQGWFTYDSRPRFGTNYYGIRGGISILSEAYSHDPFARRVAVTYDFVREILSWVAEHGAAVRAHSRAADSLTATAGAGTRPVGVPLRSRMARAPHDEAVPVELTARSGDSTMLEVGMPKGERRTGEVRAVTMPVYDRFEPTLVRALPWGWAIPPEVADSLLPRLALHGVAIERLRLPTPATVEAFAVDSIVRAQRPFQGHHEVRLTGRWGAATQRGLPAGTVIVRAAQPLGVLASFLLAPESEDGFATWNALDAFLRAGGEYPVVRLLQPLPGARD